MSLLDLLKSYPLQVQSLEKRGEFCLLHLDKPEGLSWQPASYARFVLPDSKPNRKTERALTLASHPDEGVISVLFRSGEEASSYKKTLAKVSPGQLVGMRYLYSQLKLNSLNLPQLFFASDVGMAAVRPLVLELLKEERPQLAVHHLNRGCSIFDGELSQLAKDHQSLSYQQVSGEADMAEALDQAVASHRDQAVYYLVGFPNHVRSWDKYLKAQGIPSKHIKKEAFTGLK